MLYFYLAVINILSALAFSFDKFRVLSGKRRIPEIFLHFLEFAGGALSVVFLMHIIRHKNRKLSYILITYFAFVVWLYVIFHVYEVRGL
ncbi:MAG: DUF1294 domain-containing protein [Patescibacteria group bacterium]|nr:DUF1294 domain-containing protein [Patescibacteria group bacterium]MDD4610420.1 DUF1294 domain-containing protein [Patescibacteria group bacterium]